MGFVLKLIGMMFLLFFIIGILAATAYYFFYIKLKKICNELTTLVESGSMPSRIRLIPLSGFPFKNDKKVKRFIKEFEGLGFEYIGTYKVKELSEVFIAVFLESQKNIYGVITEHPTAGVYCKVGVSYINGSSISANNCPKGGGLNPAPRFRKIHKKDAGISQLTEFVTEDAQGKKVIVVTRESFVSMYEEAYAAEIDALAARGGANEEEIRRIASRMKGRVNAKLIDAVRREQAIKASAHLELACRETFLKNSEMSAMEWEKKRDRVIVVHDMMSKEEVISIIVEALGLSQEKEQELIEAAEKTSIGVRALFAHHIANIAPKGRVSSLGEVKEPVGADIYEIC